jgi:AraC family transcriptional activator of tynA and feaB
MQTIFSTDTVHPRDKFDCWHSMACKKFVNHDRRPEDRLTFAAQIEVATLRSLELVQFSNSSLEVSHTLAHVRNTSPDWLFVCCQLSGWAVISQNGNEAALTPGTLALVEPLLPYDARFLGESKMLCIKAPRRELRARLGRNHELVARLVTADRLEDSLTLSFAAQLPSLAGKIDSVTEEMVESHALDLMGLSIARTIAGASFRVSIPKSVVLGQIRTAIEARLADPKLDAQAVAEAVGISVRYANRLFEDQDTSLKRFILSRRLARCRLAFGDPNQSHRTVSEIAQGWGFSDMTHLARRFKEAYGVSPSEYQKLAGQSGRGVRF